MGEHKAVVRLVGLRHAKKGSIIAEALEIIDPRFPRIGAAAGKILERCNALDEVSHTPQDCESRCNSKGYHRTSIVHAKCTVPVDAELYK
jgi:hypothetical protein